MILSWAKWRLLPTFELKKFKKIDFFPVGPLNLKDLPHGAELCIGTKTRTIGDALLLTPLPGRIKSIRPDLKITTYPRGYNPWVFLNHPEVHGVSYLPKALYGDDCNWGAGHLIQVKQQFFGCAVDSDPKPEIFLNSAERFEAEQFVKTHTKSGRPLCLIHPWGGTWPKVAAQAFWESTVRELKNKFEVWQIGVSGHDVVKGVEQTLFFSLKDRGACRKMFSIMNVSKAFLGVNSGPMHVARAFNIPSFIVLSQGPMAELFKNRKEFPYFLKKNVTTGFLYEKNHHLDVRGVELTDAIQQVNEFMSGVT